MRRKPQWQRGCGNTVKELKTNFKTTKLPHLNAPLVALYDKKPPKQFLLPNRQDECHKTQATLSAFLRGAVNKRS